MIYSHYYKLGDVIIRMDTDFEYYAEYGYMKDFMVDESEFYDFHFCFRKISDIQPYLNEMKEFIIQVDKYCIYRNDDKEYRFHLHDNYYHAVTLIHEKKGYCYYIDQDVLSREVKSQNHLENFMSLEIILMQFQVMSLHSCHIAYKNQGILFTAPSGTGKSTQGELWRNYQGSDVINGDRTLIGKKEGVWSAFGAPFCGTSGIKLNREEPLKAIVVIRQAKKNQVVKVTMREAVHYLFSELTINNWNVNYVNQTFDWIGELLKSVPVFLLNCDISENAVDVLKTCLLNEGVIHD